MEGYILRTTIDNPLYALKQIALGLAWLAFACFVAYQFVSQENTIYYIDQLDHWRRYIGLGESLRMDFFSTMKSTFNGIRTQEYNQIVILPLVPFYYLFGDSRLVFILLSVFIFLMPTAYSFAYLQKVIHQRAQGNNISQAITWTIITISLAMALLFPRLWHPLLRGIESIWGIAVSNILFALYIRKPLEQQRIHTIFMTGATFAFLILLRRWYMIWSVAFMVALAFDQLYMLIHQRFDWKRYIQAASRVAATGISIGLVLLVFATPIFFRYITTQYGDLYSGYQISNPTLVRRISIELFDYYGLYPLILMGAGFVLMIISKETRRIALFLGIQWMMTFGILSHLQQPSIAHHILLIPAIVIFSTYTILTLLVSVAAYKPMNIMKNILAYCLIGGYAVMLFGFLFPQFSSLRNYAKTLIPTSTYYPITRNDLSELLRLQRALHQDTNGERDSIYLIGNSSLLNTEILRFMHISLPDAPDISRSVAASSVVDKVDGIKPSLFKAKTIIVTDPLQYSLKPNDQQVIGLPARLLISRTGIGTAFEKETESYILEKGVRVLIYKRIRPFRRQDIDAYVQTLKEMYPGKEHIFDVTIPPEAFEEV